ncbi:DUF1610 domain-containing protein [Candidatus Woesearchaeota archaeon]|nr:DUF1610 domain-containing protein [Candidatus Woesearchaeota archaeon]MBL7050637.1 DUF1610 domain-containing protein [Candidatus Woesearchaeota archaeon]
MAEIKYCTGCKKNIANTNEAVNFKCPKCGKHEIIRCDHCRKIATGYTCPECGFVGP